jgi:hypothetical protein
MGKLTALLIDSKAPPKKDDKAAERAEAESALADAVAQMRNAKTDREAAMWFRSAYEACDSLCADDDESDEIED